MLTAEVIRKIAPRARQDYVDALTSGAEHFEKWQVNTPERLSAFLATICHETGGLTIVRESGNYTASRIKQVWPTRPEAVKFAGNAKGLFNAVYGSRMGNERDGTSDDDGWRFRGGGLVQLTGRDSYERAGRAIGVPLGEHPELIEDAKVSLQAALWEFSEFRRYADKGESGFRAVCNGINRGNPLSSLAPIGWQDRLEWYGKCTKCLGACVAPDDTLEVGDSGALVKAVQERLAALGYASGKTDGVFGSRTRAALLAFQAENGIATGGKVDAATRTALNSYAAKPMPVGERGSETIADLRAAGSTTIQVTDSAKAVAKAAGTVGTTFMVADQTGVLDSAGDLLKDMGQFKGIATGMTEMLTWAAAHWFYLLPLGAYLLYRWANTIEGRRLLTHRLGLDLSR